MEIKVGKYSIPLTNPDKILFPKAQITKQDLVEYYEKIASYMIPHIKHHPVTMHRFPGGIKGELFYQKDIPPYFPEYVAIQPVKRESGGIVDYALINNKAALVYLGNYVCVPHIWLSKEPKLNYPDRMIFDFDPSPGVSFASIKWAAKKMKELLESLKLPVFVMSTGSRGLHVVVPLKQRDTFDEVRAFAQSVGSYLVEKFPAKLTLDVRKNKRGKRIFIDTLRNAWGATAVAPYAVRAREGAPIAVPLSWQELSRLKTPQAYTLKNIFQRLIRTKDLWKDFSKKSATLQTAKRLLKRLL